MPEDVHSLIQDTLAYLKSSTSPKQVFFSSEEASAFFLNRPKKASPFKEIPLERIPQPSISKILKEPQKPQIEKQPIKQTAPAPSATTEQKPLPPNPAKSSSLMKKTLQQIAPHLKLVDEIPDDVEAQRIASAWKEKIPDTDVVLIACDTKLETLELLKSLAKAIEQHLAKSKVISAERLEREKRWDLFLTQNTLRLVIVSEGLQSFPELMQHYRALPANAEFFLAQTPLIPLSQSSLYKSLEHKALLWKTLCQMLKK